jgi:IclR family transcriptional regulator, acetate operon repressor
MEKQTTLSRGFEVLAVVCELAPTTVEAVATNLGLPLSTAYRYVRTLRELGFIQEYEGYYDVGVRMLGLVRDVRAEEALARLASPLLFDLVSRTSETATLVVADGDLARTVISIEPHRPVRLSFRTGAMLPLHAGAPAKVLLAHMPEAFVRGYLARAARTGADSQPSFTKDLNEQLQEICERGVCVTHGEVDADAVGVAAPLFRRKELVAAISVAGPASRLGARAIGEAERLVQVAARQLESVLEGTIPPTSASLDSVQPHPAAGAAGARRRPKPVVGRAHVPPRAVPQ